MAKITELRPDLRKLTNDLYDLYNRAIEKGELNKKEILALIKKNLKRIAGKSKTGQQNAQKIMLILKNKIENSN